MTNEFKAYIDTVQDERKELLLMLHNSILRLYPEVEQKISFRILIYKRKPGWVGLGYGKQGVTLYSEAIPTIAKFKSKHPKLKTGKGCINLKLTDEIPLEDLEQVISYAMDPWK